MSGAPIEGAQFHVMYTRVSDIPDAPATYDFGTLYSNADGEIPLHETGVKLYPGKYTVTETAPAPGFQMREPTTQSVTIKETLNKSRVYKERKVCYDGVQRIQGTG